MKIAESSNSDTPETDMLLSDQQHDCVPYDDAAEQLADLAQKLERERDEAREDAKRATYNATQETLKVVRWLGAWIEACRERDEAREAFSIATDQCVLAQAELRKP